jgi:hypothetical protein
MRHAEARTERGEVRRILQRRDGLGRGPDESVPLGEARDEPWRIFETAAEDEADNRAGSIGQFVEGVQRRVVGEGGTEPSGQRSVGSGQCPSVGIAEQVGHVGPEAGAPGRLGQGAPGLGGDQDRVRHPDAGSGPP